MLLIQTVKIIGKKCVHGVLAITILGVGYRADQIFRRSGVDPLRAVVEITEQAPAWWKPVTWIFYSMHFMQIRVRIAGVASENEAFSLFNSSAWSPVYFLVPVLALGIVGFVSGYLDSDSDSGNLPHTGVGMTIGYGVVGAIVLVLSSWDITCRSSMVYCIRTYKDSFSSSRSH